MSIIKTINAPLFFEILKEIRLIPEIDNIHNIGTATKTYLISSIPSYLGELEYFQLKYLYQYHPI